MKKTPQIILVLASFSTGYSQSLTFAALSNGDVTIYGADNSSPIRQLTLNNALPPTEALVGTASDAGGNIELFTSSDFSTFDDPAPGGNFAVASPTVLTAGFSNGSTVTVSGLSGQDWFLDSGNVYSTSYGANNLANAWFNDFLEAIDLQSGGASSALLAGNEAEAYNSFLGNGGFAQLSDPNVSFIDALASSVNVGLAGFEDSTDRVALLLNVSPMELGLFFPNGLQLSEVALVNGEAAYGFSGVNSGVVLNDGIDSYAASFVVSVAVPEPSSSLLVLLAGVIGLVRRKR